MNKIIISLSIVLAMLLLILVACIIKDNKKIESKKRETVVASTSESEDTEQSSGIEGSETEKKTEAVTTEPSQPTEITQEASSAQATEETTEETKLPSATENTINEDAEHTGRFTSNTGSGLELLVDWTICTGADGKRIVRFNVSLDTHSIYAGARKNGIQIKMGEATASVDSNAISYSVNSRTEILLGSCTMEMTNTEADVTVSWAFRGSYNGVAFNTVQATGHIS